MVVAVALLALLVWTPCVVVALGLLTIGEHRRQPWRRFGTYRDLLRLLFFNALVLAAFCGLWYGGYFMSAHWQRLLDLGGLRTWLIALFIASYIATLLPLRRHPKRLFTSLLGPLITAPVFFAWAFFCTIKFDANF